MTKFVVKMRDFEGKLIQSIFEARGYKSAIREAIKTWKQEIIYTGGSRVQFEVSKESETKNKFYDVYFEWDELGEFKPYRIDKVGEDK